MTWARIYVILNCFDIRVFLDCISLFDRSLRLSFSFISNRGFWKESRGASAEETQSETIVLHCWHAHNGPGDPCHAVTCCPLVCHALSRILSRVFVVSSAVMPRHAAASWSTEDGQQLRGLGGRGEDIMWQHPSKRAPPSPGKMLASHYHPPTDISGYL